MSESACFDCVVCVYGACVVLCLCVPIGACNESCVQVWLCVFTDLHVWFACVLVCLSVCVHSCAHVYTCLSV